MVYEVVRGAYLDYDSTNGRNNFKSDDHLAPSLLLGGRCKGATEVAIRTHA